MRVKGIDKLKRGLKAKATLAGVRKIVCDNTLQLEGLAKRNAVFVKGYSTGATKRSINLAFKDGGLTGVVKPTSEYSPYLEFGTRFMAPQPFMRPSYQVQKEKFKQDMARVMK